MTVAAVPPATYADIERAPPHVVAEIVDGELMQSPRPMPRHSLAMGGIYENLNGPFRHGRGGPGGWVLMIEPELHLGRDVVVPDVAGWRRERLPALPKSAHLSVVPDWVCEVLSPSTQRFDRGPKRRVYAQAGVAYLWLLDPVAQVLETFRLVDGQWLLTGTANGTDSVALPPFEVISFPMAELFPFDAPKGGDVGADE